MYKWQFPGVCWLKFGFHTRTYSSADLLKTRGGNRV